MRMPSGYLSGVSGHLDSSHSVEQESTDGAQILEEHVDQTEVRTTPSPSSHSSIQIAPTGPDIPQEQDNSNRDIHSRFDALKPPCQTAPYEFSVVKMTGGSSFGKSELSTSDSLGVLTDQQDLETPQEHVTGCNFFPNEDESEAGKTQTNASNRFPELMLTEGDSGPGLDDCLTSAARSSDSDALDTPHSDIVIATGLRASQHTLDFSLSSLNLPLSPDFSHQVDVKSCEQVRATFTESSKSTACRSDDILSRSTLKVDLATNTKSDCRGISVRHINSFLSPLEPLERARVMTAIDSVPEEQDIPTIGCSLAPQDKLLKQSHEETAIPSVSDHLDVALSSSTAQIEYLQSHPYFEPATITRVYSPYISTEVVGTPNPRSSSPPSSPSMNSHYMPSSSPLPSSSPVGGSSQISPPSSPAHQDAYIQPSMSNSGSQQAYHSDDNYSTLPHYAMEHMYYKPVERNEVEGSYMQPPIDYLGSTSAAITPSYPLGFFNQQAEPTPTVLINDHYNHTNTNDYLPVQVSIESSEPPSDNTRYEDTRYETNAYNPIPIPQEYIPPNIAQYQTTSVEDEGTTSTATPQDNEPAKANVVPRPKRSTIAGQRQQQKKLSKPFRSPVLHAPVRLAPKPPIVQTPVPIAASDKSVVSQEARSASAGTSTEQSASAVASSSSQTLDTKSKHRTTRAASQFKSPLPSTSTPLDEATLVRLTPTIQSLERKLQLLRRALKVREDVQEEVLEGLVKKWSEAGREAAWEVWDVVKDNANSEDVQGDSSKGKGKKRAIDESWGWDESGDQKKPRVEEKERNWGWDVVPVSEREGDGVQPEEDESTVAEHQQEEEGEEGAPQPSLGTMLIQLGIAPETLGWDEDEGSFVDR